MWKKSSLPSYWCGPRVEQRTSLSSGGAAGPREHGQGDRATLASPSPSVVVSGSAPQKTHGEEGWTSSDVLRLLHDNILQAEATLHAQIKTASNALKNHSSSSSSSEQQRLPLQLPVWGVHTPVTTTASPADDGPIRRLLSSDRRPDRLASLILLPHHSIHPSCHEENIENAAPLDSHQRSAGSPPPPPTSSSSLSADGGIMLRSLQSPTVHLPLDAALFRLIADAPKSNGHVFSMLTEELEPSVPLRITESLLRCLWIYVSSVLLLRGGKSRDDVLRRQRSEEEEEANRTSSSRGAANGRCVNNTIDADICEKVARLEWEDVSLHSGATLKLMFSENPKEAMYFLCCLWFFDLVRGCHNTTTSTPTDPSSAGVDDDEDEEVHKEDGDDDNGNNNNNNSGRCHLPYTLDAVRVLLSQLSQSSQARWRLLDASVALERQSMGRRARAALHESFGIFLSLVTSGLKAILALETQELHMKMTKTTIRSSSSSTSREIDGKNVAAAAAAAARALLVKEVLHPSFEVSFTVEKGRGSVKHVASVAVPEANSATLNKLRVAALRRGEVASRNRQRDLDEANELEAALNLARVRRETTQEDQYLRRRAVTDCHNRLRSLRCSSASVSSMTVLTPGLFSPLGERPSSQEETKYSSVTAEKPVGGRPQSSLSSVLSPPACHAGGGGVLGTTGLAKCDSLFPPSSSSVERLHSGTGKSKAVATASLILSEYERRRRVIDSHDTQTRRIHDRKWRREIASFSPSQRVLTYFSEHPCE